MNHSWKPIVNKVFIINVILFLFLLFFSSFCWGDIVDQIKPLTAEVLIGESYREFLKLISKLEKIQDWKKSYQTLKEKLRKEYLLTLASLYKELYELDQEYDEVKISKSIAILMDNAQYLVNNFTKKQLLKYPLSLFMSEIGKAEVSHIKFLGWIEYYLNVDIAEIEIDSLNPLIIKYNLKDSPYSGWHYQLDYKITADKVFHNRSLYIPEERVVIYYYNKPDEKFTIIAKAENSNWNFEVGYWADKIVSSLGKIEFAQADYRWKVTKISSHTITRFYNQKYKSPDEIITIFKKAINLEGFIAYLSDKNINIEHIAIYRYYYDPHRDASYIEASTIKERKIASYQYNGKVVISPAGIKHKDGRKAVPSLVLEEYEGIYAEEIPGFFRNFRRQHLIISILDRKIELYGKLYGYLLPSDIKLIKQSISKLSSELRFYIRRIYFLTPEEIKAINKYLVKSGGFVDEKERFAIYLKIYHGIIPTDIGDYAHEGTHLMHRILDEKSDGKFTKLIKAIAETKEEKFGKFLKERDQLGYYHAWKDKSAITTSGPAKGAFSAYAWNNPYEYLAVAVENFYKNPTRTAEIIFPKGNYSYLHKDKYDARYLKTLIIAYKFNFIPATLYANIISKLLAEYPQLLEEAKLDVEKLIDAIYY